MSSVSRRIVCLLHFDDADYCRQKSMEIAGAEDTFFTLGTEQTVPHVTLVSAHLPAGMDDRAWEIVQAVASTAPRITLTFTHVEAVEGWICVMTDCPPALRALHEALLDPVCDLRTPDIVASMQPTDEASMEPHLLAYARAHGHTSVHEYYDPHVTLTRVKQIRHGPRVAASVDWQLPTLHATEIALCESGEHGVCTRILKYRRLHSYSHASKKVHNTT